MSRLVFITLQQAPLDDYPQREVTLRADMITFMGVDKDGRGTWVTLANGMRVLVLASQSEIKALIRQEQGWGPHDQS